MLQVKTPTEVKELLQEQFVSRSCPEAVPLEEAFGRVLAEEIYAEEYVPDFDRSTVDGYAVRAADTFGCSDSMPAILVQVGTVHMGESALGELHSGECMAVPTGGDLPKGADACVMIEYTEDYSDGTIGILKPVAPGANRIFRGDDVKPNDLVLPKGTYLSPTEIGALAALGRAFVRVEKKRKVGIISTGDELVSHQEALRRGQIRDVNSMLLEALLKEAGAEPKRYGIVKDQEALLSEKVKQALLECDMVLISGGSSVGTKDATCRVIEQVGELLLHGIAMKPGKPTILGKAGEKAIFGLPGHPVAAYFVAKLFVVPLLKQWYGEGTRTYPVRAVLQERVEANHGRAQYMGVYLIEEKGVLFAKPVRSKSGLITSLANTAGFIEVARDCEGLEQGAEVFVYR